VTYAEKRETPNLLPVPIVPQHLTIQLSLYCWGPMMKCTAKEIQRGQQNHNLSFSEGWMIQGKKNLMPAIKKVIASSE